MDLIEQLEGRINGLLDRLRHAEEENARLRLELEDARKNKEAVLERIDGLLQRVQEELG